MKRFGFEFLLVLLLVLVAAGIWLWKDRQAENAVQEAQQQADQRVESVVDSGERWARTLAESQARAAFRAFAAGVHPLVLGGGRAQVLDQAIGGLLELPAVTFVHILGPDGAVMASSDRKLQTTGEVPESAAWVTTTNDLAEQPGDTPGVLELAAPVHGPAGPFAYLWMGYDLDHLMNRARPTDWPAGGGGPGGEAVAEEAPETGPVESPEDEL